LRSIKPYIWILPALAFITALKFYPIFFSIALSLFEWNVFEPEPFGNFIGFSNYRQLLQDGTFINAFVQSIVYTVSTITIQLGIAYLLAVFIFFGKFWGADTIRAIIFFPGVVSAVFVANASRRLVFLRDGFIYRVTNMVGLPDIFLLPEYAFEIVLFIGLWQFIGFNLIIFYAGLQSLDKEVLDSARIDGAGFWRLVINIVTPLQRLTMLVVAMFNVIFAVQLFDLPKVFGGNVLGTYLVNVSFGSRIGGPLGYASAMSTVMIVMMLLFSYLRSRLLSRIDY